MACGPYVVAERSVPAAGRVNELFLTNITAEDARALFPLQPDDPTLDYLFPSQHELFTRSDAANAFMERIVENPRNVTWGIMHGEDEPLLGFASLTLLGEGEEPGYTIMLRQSAQKQGVGTLVTAAIVAAASHDGLLYDANPWYPFTVPALATLIHSDNEPSQRMCNRLGFVLEEKQWVEDADMHVYAYRLGMDGLRRVALDNSIILADVRGDQYHITTYV